jgi:hypothetical protein
MKGFILIELLTTITIVLVVAAVTATPAILLMQLFLYLPQESQVRSIAQDAMDLSIDGSPGLRGMRYCIRVREALPGQFVYEAYTTEFRGQRRLIYLRLDSVAKKLYRSWEPLVDYGPAPSFTREEAVIPYYAAGADISVTGPAAAPGAIFTYYRTDGTPWVRGTDRYYDIGRVEIRLTVKTGSGLFSAARGSFELMSSIEIKQYIETPWPQL